MSEDEIAVAVAIPLFAAVPFPLFAAPPAVPFPFPISTQQLLQTLPFAIVVSALFIRGQPRAAFMVASLGLRGNLRRHFLFCRLAALRAVGVVAEKKRLITARQKSRCT